MYEVHHIARVKELLGTGLSKTAVASRLGISRRVIYHWITEGHLVAAASGGTRRRVRRESKLDPFREFIETRLATDPSLSAAQLYREMTNGGYVGGITQVRALVASLRPAPNDD